MRLKSPWGMDAERGTARPRLLVPKSNRAHAIAGGRLILKMGHTSVGGIVANGHGSP